MKFNGKNGTFLIAEIGGNHEGDFAYAQELTQLACDSGVDAVKFQIYTGDSLVNKKEDPDRNAHFKKFELKKQEYIFLSKQCKKNNVEFSASVWNPDAFSWIDPYLNFYKVGSGDMTAYPILDIIISFGKPILLSTGLSTMEEVIDTVKYIQAKNQIYLNRNFLAILQCTSMYPIPFEDANLNVINEYKKEFKLKAGYSDHTKGSLAVETAVSMGADIIEFHFTDSREGKVFRDHQISFTKDETIELIDKIKKINSLKGDGKKKPLKSELSSGHVQSFRRGLYFNKNLSKGDMIRKQDIVALRPNHGLDSRNYYKIIGRKLNCDVERLEKISLDLFS